MKLVQLAHDHYTHQLEVEKTIQGQTLSTKNEKTTLQKITQTTMEEDQREAAELATSLAAKRAGQAPRKRKRDDSSPPKTTGIPTRGVGTDSKSQIQEQNCTVQDKDTLHKEEGEKGKTETESKDT